LGNPAARDHRGKWPKGLASKLEVNSMADNKSMTGFIGVAAFAHLLAWLWRPWL
jgi:hypothetical protein